MTYDRRIARLERIANAIRCDVVRMICKANSGHPGGSLSAVDILVALYFQVMRINPKEPDWPERDRFVLSKGHACPALYAILARKGYFPRHTLWTLRRVNSILQGHPDMRKTPGIDMTTGSMGQGLSAAIGMAQVSKLSGLEYRVFVMLGDGEVQEGQIWEAAMAASKYKLDNVVAILDYNKLQVDGTISQIMPIEPLADKWRSFGWNVLEIDGHNMREILCAFEIASFAQGKPSIIIAHTTKGKGVSFMENKVEWHSSGISKEQMCVALEELRKA